MSLIGNSDKLNENSLLSEEKLSNDDDGVNNKKLNSILKKPKAKKQNSANSVNDLKINKKKPIDESSIDMLNDNTLDGFSIEENTVTSDVIVDNENDDLSQECSQNVVTFNLNDNKLIQDASESSTSQQQKPESVVKKRKKRTFNIDPSIA